MQNDRANKGRPTPIFVVGSARNGTTWLCNTLAGHPDVSAAQHAAHWGFHESNVLKNRRYWGDLSNLNRRIRFIALYQRADHCALVGGNEEILEQAIEAAVTERGTADFYDVFFEVMDRFALGNDTRYWLTKLDPLLLVYPAELRDFLSRLLERYPDAKLISIQREVTSVVQSYLNMEGRGSQRRTHPLRAPMFALFEIARYLVHYRRVRWIHRNHSVTAVTYQSLHSKSEETLRLLCKQLEIAYEFSVHGPQFPANSSVAYRARFRKIGTVSRLLIRGVAVPILWVMWPFTVGIVRRRERFRPITPPIYFKLIKLQDYPQQFRSELLGADDTALAQLLFPQEDQQ